MMTYVFLHDYSAELVRSGVYEFAVNLLRELLKSYDCWCLLPVQLSTHQNEEEMLRGSRTRRKSLVFEAFWMADLSLSTATR